MRPTIAAGSRDIGNTRETAGFGSRGGGGSNCNCAADGRRNDAETTRTVSASFRGAVCRSAVTWMRIELESPCRAPVLVGFEMCERNGEHRAVKIVLARVIQHESHDMVTLNGISRFQVA